MEIGSFVLDNGKTPAQWIELLAERGLRVSERTLRTKARQLAACHVLGGAMLITPQQIDRILEDAACRLPRTNETAHGGRAGRSNTTASRSPATSGKALAHLQKLARGSGSPIARRGKSAGTS
jgi:hypothetical protein